jgi:hypothetical protein
MELNKSTNKDGGNTLKIKNKLEHRIKERVGKATPFVVKGIEI